MYEKNNEISKDENKKICNVKAISGNERSQTEWWRQWKRNENMYEKKARMKMNESLKNMIIEDNIWKTKSNE